MLTTFSGTVGSQLRQISLYIHKWLGLKFNGEIWCFTVRFGWFFHWLVCSVVLLYGGGAEHDVLTCVALLLLVCFLIENPVFFVF
jgi:hypothetical protein